MTTPTETPRTDAVQCEAGMLSADRCKNPATLETNTGYKCCKYHAPMREGKYREDVKPITTDTPRTDACPVCTDEQQCWECAPDVSVSDTPRTDALIYGRPESNRGLSPQEAAFKIVDFARELERELASIKADNFDLANALSKAEAELMRLQKGYCYACEPTGELNQKLEAEVERLKEQYEAAAESVARMHEAAVGEIRGPITSVIDDIKAVRERAEKAEANLRRAIEIAENGHDCTCSGCVNDRAKLDQLKETLNQTDK